MPDETGRLTAAALTRRYAIGVAALQLTAGIVGLSSGASHFSAASYQPAKNMLGFLPGDPSRWWCAILVILSSAAIFAVITRRSVLARNVFALLCGYWMFWAVIFIVAFATNPTGGPLAPWLALITIVGDSRPVLGRLVDQ